MKRKVVELKDALKEKKARDGCSFLPWLLSLSRGSPPLWLVPLLPFCIHVSFSLQRVQFGLVRVIIHPSVKRLWVEICTCTCACG
jgi:hypothetical protein